MDLKAFLSMVFFTIVASRAPKEEEFYVHNHADDYVDYEYDDQPRAVQTDRPTSASSVTNKPAASYEVTEKVDDIPNNVTYTGPIVANFTIKLPHNNATVVNNTNTINNNNNTNNEIDIDDFDNIFNGFGDTDSNKVNKRQKNNSINIFNVHNKYDDHKSTVKNIYINKVPFGSFHLKDNVNRFKDGVVDFIHNVKNSDIYNNVNKGFVVPFFNKLERKGSAVATKLHDAIFGYFDDY